MVLSLTFTRKAFELMGVLVGVLVGVSMPQTRHEFCNMA